MANNITLNTSNIINLNKGNNRFEYTFPIETEFKEGSSIALSDVNIFLSWYNVTKAYNNNVLTYIFFNMSGEEESYDITFVDGFYTVATLYEYIQTVLTERGHYLEYLEAGSGGQVQILYPISLRANSTFYKLDFIFVGFAQQMDFGEGLVDYTTIFKAPSTWAVPTEMNTMALQMTTYGNINEYFGFNKGELVKPSVIDPVNFKFYNVLSSTIPQVMPSSSYIVNCNLCNNELNRNRMSLSTFAIKNGVGFGDLITLDGTPVYNQIQPGKYRTLYIEILDQNFNALQILDPNILINLSVIKNI
jgi:hypothetical protein